MFKTSDTGGKNQLKLHATILVAMTETRPKASGNSNSIPKYF